MFVFEDIIQLKDNAIQRIIREVETKDLAISLKGTREEIKEKIYNKRKVKCILRQRSDKYVGRIFDSPRIGKMMKGYQ